MKVKLIVADWLDATTGNLFVIDGAKEASVGYCPGPFIDVESEPLRIVMCHPTDEERVRAALDEEDAELVF
jgi:hypothetical protein